MGREAYAVGPDETARKAFLMELGVYSFGDLAADVRTGQEITTRQRLADLVAQAKMADEAGIEVFALGEHHRRDFTLSAPELVLAAIASVTSGSS